MLRRPDSREHVAFDHEVDGAEFAAATLASLPDVSVLLFDRSLRYRAVAGAALERHGYDRENLIGRTPAEVLPPAAWERLRPAYAAALDGRSTVVEFESLDRQAVYETTFSPIASGARTIGGMALSRDITARRRAEAALAATSALFERSFSAAPIGKALIAPDGAVLRTNDALGRLLGVAVDDLLGDGLGALIEPDSTTPGAGLPFPEAADELRVVRRLRRSDATHVQVEVSMSAVLGHDDHPEWLVAQFVPLETQAPAATDTDASSSASRAIAIVVHQIRSPLAAISGAASVLAATTSEPVPARYLDMVTRNAQRIRRLVDDLALIGRPPTPRPSSPRTCLDLYAVAADAAFDARHAAPARRDDITMTGADGVWVDGDRDGLHHVLDNLLANAIAYGGSGPITVAVSSEGPEAVVRVRDCGPGVPADERRTVFGAFQRGRLASRQAPGSGLGLTVARAVVEAHGGTIEIEQPAGGGASVRVGLPRRVPSEDGGRGTSPLAPEETR